MDTDANLQLQHTVGNHEVLRMLCTPATLHQIYTKRASDLSIIHSDDAQEKQADAIAKQVVSGNAVSPVTSSGASGVHPKKEGEIPQVTHDFESKLNSSKGGGEPLNESVKSEMQGKMGADLSDVKVHADGAADEMAKVVNAKAFTHGHHVYFKDGNYNSDTVQGRELLAHELVHTRQARLPGIRRTPALPTESTNPVAVLSPLTEEKPRVSDDAELRSALDEFQEKPSRPSPTIPITLDLLALLMTSEDKSDDKDPKLPRRKRLEGGTYHEFKGQAFVEGTDDVDAIDPDDVQQGDLGDCVLLAALIAIARANPKAIRDLIEECEDGTYEVTLHFKDRFWDRKTAHRIRVKPTFLAKEEEAEGTSDFTPDFAKQGDVTKDGPELWVMLIEKAYAIYRGGYNKVDKGTTSRRALNVLSTGVADKATNMNHNTSEKDMKDLGEMVSSKQYAVIAGTRELEDDMQFYVGRHFVTELDEGNLSEALREAFRVNDRPLAADALIKIEVVGERWEINEAGNRYLIEKMGRNLSVSFPSDEKKKDDERNLVGGHEYAIICVDEIEKTLDLQNPWGLHTDVIGLSYAEFPMYFEYWRALRVKE